MHLAKIRGNPITNDIFYQKAAFCEIFIDKRSYSRRKALSLCRDLINGYEIKKEHMMFLDLKIENGIFKLLGALDEYVIYRRIVEKIRDSLLKTFYCIDYNEECAYLDTVYDVLINCLFKSLYPEE